LIFIIKKVFFKYIVKNQALFFRYLHYITHFLQELKFKN